MESASKAYSIYNALVGLSAFESVRSSTQASVPYYHSLRHVKSHHSTAVPQRPYDNDWDHLPPWPSNSILTLFDVYGLLFFMSIFFFLAMAGIWAANVTTQKNRWLEKLVDYKLKKLPIEAQLFQPNPTFQPNPPFQLQPPLAGCNGEECLSARRWKVRVVVVVDGATG